MTRHICVAIAAASLLVSGSERSSPLAGVIVITLDTTRADRLGAYGYPNAGTPNLDALAQDGVLFDHASTSAPITLPAHSSLLLVKCTASTSPSSGASSPSAIRTAVGGNPSEERAIRANPRGTPRFSP